MRCSAAPHLNLSRNFVSTAGHVDNKWPLVWLHKHSSSLGTGRVVRSRTAAMRALHTAARCLLHSLLTVVTFLPEITTKKELGIRI